uniref:Metal transporter CNNM2 n=1 Tax=Ascaris suum TaxID=6253 RepID=F1L0R6_ASCSU
MYSLMAIFLLGFTQQAQTNISRTYLQNSVPTDGGLLYKKMSLLKDEAAAMYRPFPLRISSMNFPSIDKHMNLSSGQPIAFGFRVERRFDDKENGLLVRLSAQVPEAFVLFGRYTSRIRRVWFSSDPECSKWRKNVSRIVPVRILHALSNCILQCETLPINDVIKRPMQACIDPPAEEQFPHLPFTQILLEEPDPYVFPLYIEIPIIVMCAMLSSIFSGLTTGLMALSADDLVLISEGSEDINERQYAANILPLRQNGNFLLCSIVLGNTFTNCITTLLINDLCKNVNGEAIQLLVALIIPTLIITLFGEILPQAVCSNYGLMIGSRTRYLTIFFMVLFCPISYPVSKFLDMVVGVEGRDVYDRKTLRVLITMQRDLIKDAAKKQIVDHKMIDVDTTDLVLAAIDFPEKIVMSVMTPIDKIFMLSDCSVIDKALLKTIAAKGRTRIPIYKGKDRDTIVGVLNMKDLLPFCQSSQLKVGTVAQLWQRSSQFRFALGGTRVMQLMIEMKNGVPIAMVVKFDEHRRDYIVMGLLTLEDVVEEVVGEIMDEQDAKMSKQSRRSPWKKNVTTDL